MALGLSMPALIFVLEKVLSASGSSAAVLGPAAHLGDHQVAGRELRDAAREGDAGGDDADADAGGGLEVLGAGEAIAETVGGVGLLAGGLVDRLLFTGVAAGGDDRRGEEGGDREAEEEDRFHRGCNRCSNVWSNVRLGQIAQFVGARPGDRILLDPRLCRILSPAPGRKRTAASTMAPCAPS